MSLPLPLLLADRPAAQRTVAAVIVPVVFGAVAGVVLGVSEGAYLVLLTVALLGGFGAGLEHDAPRDGILRGILGGLLFTGALLVAHEVAGTAAEATLPHPAALLLVLNTVVSAATGAAGATLRRRLVLRALSVP